jgi:DNA-binding HxlR family transcriptional regulator
MRERGGRAAVAGRRGALDQALARVGDRWSLLVIGALIEGPQRFSTLQEMLPGCAPNVLSARLRRLAADGLITAVPYLDRPLRLEYQVSAEGRELAGALRLLARWGAAHGGDPSDGPRHPACGTPLEARWYCPTCDRVSETASDEAVWV